MRLMDIAIVGYGSAGQALAIALARDGHRVRVFEQVPQPGPVGAGFLLQPTGMLPGGRLQMLRILTGTRSGWIGQWRLPPGFAEALARA